MNGKEIIEVIKESRRVDYREQECWQNLEDMGLGHPFTQQIGEFELVSQTTDPDAYSFDTICVWHFKDHNIYISGNVGSGSYSSGYKLDTWSLKEVVPVKKEITVFEEKPLMTAEEILEKIEASGIPVSVFAYDDHWMGDGEVKYDPETGEETEWDSDDLKVVMDALKAELGGWEQIEQKGGEGQGDVWFAVKHFPAHDVYIRTDGWYTSYHGTDFDDCYGKEVKPVKKIVTLYE